MQNIYLALIFFVLGIPTLFAQNSNVSEINSHIAFVKELESSKDNRYQEILEQYDSYISREPDAVQVQIYRCKFIGNAYYDKYEDYNPNWEETQDCIDLLYKKNSDNTKVILYRLENLYGEDLALFLEEAIDFYYSNTDKWDQLQASKLFKIATSHYQNKNPNKALDFALKAKLYNHDLDNSLSIANLYRETGNIEKSKQALLEGLDYDNEAWTLNQKGELLIEYEEFEKAIELFERVKEKDSSYVNYKNLYKILINKEQYDEARNYLLKDTIQEWAKTAGIQKLLDHDIKYSTADVALESYKRMQKESYYDDFFGIKRLKIFLKSPFKSISAVGISHFIILLLLVFILFLVPYLWIMPIYGTAKYFKLNFNYENFWNLKHFWGISFIYLLIQFLISFLFYYESFINDWFEITYNYANLEQETTTSNELLYFSIFSLIGTLIFINKKRIKYIFTSNWSLFKIIKRGIGFFILNIILLKIIGSFVDISDNTAYFSLLNIKQEIVLLVKEKGFFIAMLVVAIFAPIYEEIIFRGIVLNSVSKHLGFKTANVIQATLFGLVHYQLSLFPFYFVFGIVTGYAAKRSNGLLAGIIFHAINNFIVVVALYYTLK